MIQESSPVRVHYTAGQANVRIGEQMLSVQRRDGEERTASCPIELIAAALGA